MKSNARKVTIGLVALTALIIPSLFHLCSSRDVSTPDASALALALSLRASSPDLKPVAAVSRRFLQSRQELLAKYGEPASRRASPPSEHLSFQSGTLKVEADISGDECHHLCYTLPWLWNDAQITAALEKNGAGWKGQTSLMGFMPPAMRYEDFESTEGHRAKYSGPSHQLEIWSCQLVEQSRQQQAERERKAAEVPKF